MRMTTCGRRGESPAGVAGVANARTRSRAVDSPATGLDEAFIGALSERMLARDVFSRKGRRAGFPPASSRGIPARESWHGPNPPARCRRSQVHGPNLRPVLEVSALHEPSRTEAAKLVTGNWSLVIGHLEGDTAKRRLRQSPITSDQ